MRRDERREIGKHRLEQARSVFFFLISFSFASFPALTVALVYPPFPFVPSHLFFFSRATRDPQLVQSVAMRIHLTRKASRNFTKRDLALTLMRFPLKIVKIA